MSRSKKIYVLLLVLLAVSLVTFGVSRYEEHKEQIKNSDETILELASEDVTSLSWEYDSHSYAFHKDETWLYDEDEAFPVNEEKISDLLGQFQEFGASFTIEDVEDFGQYGLDEPLCTIRMEAAGEAYEILLGDYSTMDSERYVSIGDGNVYLVKTDPLDYFDLELSDMILNDEIPAFDNVTKIQFAGTESYTIFYEEDSGKSYSEDDVYFVEQDGDDLPLDTSIVKNYLQTISGLDVTDYVSYNASDEDIASYGLDEPELSLTVQYTIQEDGSEEETTDTFVLLVSHDPEKEVESSDDTEVEEEKTAYIRIGESRIIYEITETEYKELMAASYDDLRHQKVIWADFSTIYQVDVSLEGEDYSLTSEEKDGEKIWRYQGEELDIADFQIAFTVLTADSFTDEQPTGKEEISLTVYLDNENYPKIQMAFYRYDGTCCIAVVDGKTVAFVERNYVVDLAEAVNGIVLNVPQS